MILSKEDCNDFAYLGINKKTDLQPPEQRFLIQIQY